MFAFARKTGSHLALAIALTAGTAIAFVGTAEPAHAQKKVKQEISKAFAEAYQPLAEQVNSGASNVAALRAAIPGLLSVAQSGDERMAAGQLVFSIGQKSQDQSLQRQGVEMMLDSGKVPAENLGQYSYLAGQLAYQQRDFPAARTRVQQALSTGYNADEGEVLIAETFFSEDRYSEGLDYLANAVDTRLQAGRNVDEAWLKRGLAVSYNNNLLPQANRFATWYVQQYPSKLSWGDAIAVALNSNQYSEQEVLDLLRLARRTETFRDDNMYKEYIETAGPRRFPGEVVAVIDEGIAAGMLQSGDPYVSETRALAAGRVDADRADLPSLEAEAMAASAPLNTVVAAGDAFLSYDDPAKAEQLYRKALEMPGADTPTLLTRLGIAQADQGKYGEARQTFAQVQGARQAIARLWSTYAEQNDAI